MNRLSRIVLTLPVLLLPAIATAARPAMAEATAAGQAVQILARAKRADSRCSMLSAAERAELSRYTARAEVAAASQVSAKAARAALVSGDAQGRAVKYSTALEADVRETLIAAREAIAAAEAPQDDVADSGSSGGLNRYGRLVRAYYVERQCRHLTRSQANRFWRAIVRMHKSVVARNGAAAVAPVMRRAERAARATSCGSAAITLVKTGFAESLNR